MGVKNSAVDPYLQATLVASSDSRNALDTFMIKGKKHEKLKISAHRTIRVPDGDGESELPPSMGTFPLYSVASFGTKLPYAMAAKGGVFFPMYPREALWFNFQSDDRFALKIYIGGVNAVSGEPVRRILRPRFVVSNLWLDGITSENGRVRQFVAMPLGKGYSVEAQITGEEIIGGIQFEIIPAFKAIPRVSHKYPTPYGGYISPKTLIIKTLTGKLILVQGLSIKSTIEDVKSRIEGIEGIPANQQRLLGEGRELIDEYNIHNRATLYLVLRLIGGGAIDAIYMKEQEMGIAPGGLIRQCILEDDSPAISWETEHAICFNFQILNSDFFREVTGMDPPESPITAKTYATHGLSFYKIYNETSSVKGDFGSIKSVKTLDKAKAETKRARAEHDEPPWNNPVTMLNQYGVRMPFRSVSVLEKELTSMNYAQF